MKHCLFIYNKQLVIHVIARMSSHLFFVLLLIGIQNVGYRWVHLPPHMQSSFITFFQLPNPSLSTYFTPLLLQSVGSRVESSECRVHIRVSLCLKTDQMWYINIPWWLQIHRLVDSYCCEGTSKNTSSSVQFKAWIPSWYWQSRLVSVLQAMAQRDGWSLWFILTHSQVP